MKLISWNVNGLRACLGKGFLDFFYEADADIFCLQETKLQQKQIDLTPEGYHVFWCDAVKKGYSGTAVFTKTMPLTLSYELPDTAHQGEGRVITAEYDKFYLVNVYTPNAQRELARLDYRMQWEDAFLHYVSGLNAKKPVIICGDMNVAHTEIDLKNPKPNIRNAGFTEEERGCMSRLLQAGFIDSFRHFYPDTTGAYSWWSYMYHARENNAGWRIDYFLASEKLKQNITGAHIYADISGSDHCPVGLTMNI